MLRLGSYVMLREYLTLVYHIMHVLYDCLKLHKPLTNPQKFNLIYNNYKNRRSINKTVPVTSLSQTNGTYTSENMINVSGCLQRHLEDVNLLFCNCYLNGVCGHVVTLDIPLFLDARLNNVLRTTATKTAQPHSNTLTQLTTTRDVL